MLEEGSSSHDIFFSQPSFSKIVAIHGINFSLNDIHGLWVQKVFANSGVIDSSMEIEQVKPFNPRNGRPFLLVSFKNEEDVQKILKSKYTLKRKVGWENIYIQQWFPRRQRTNSFKPFEFHQQPYKQHQHSYSNGQHFNVADSDSQLQSQYHLPLRIQNSPIPIVQQPIPKYQSNYYWENPDVTFPLPAPVHSLPGQQLLHYQTPAQPQPPTYVLQSPHPAYRNQYNLNQNQGNWHLSPRS